MIQIADKGREVRNGFQEKNRFFNVGDRQYAGIREPGENLLHLKALSNAADKLVSGRA